jgi:coenzyme F420-reducing hydrogenase beta subunit
MREDREGFLYPQIEPEKCNACGLCLAICPAQRTETSPPDGKPVVYAGWTKDPDLLHQSTSGGVFSEIARKIIEARGVVFGAAYDQSMTVRHTAVETWEALRILRGSKYVQSDVGDTYLQAERHLTNGRQVLFSGTPCQIAGLYATIGRQHANLLTCDLICHGVPSPKVFRKAIEAMATRRKSEVVDFLFREKSFGWLHPTVHVILKNGLWFQEFPRDNSFLLGFYNNLYLRRSCHQCPMKSNGPVSDITLGDFDALLKIHPLLVNPEGTSAVLVNTARGHRAIRQSAEGLSLTECAYDDLQNNPNLRRSASASMKRDKFFRDLDILTFDELSRKYLKPRHVVIRFLAYARRRGRRWVEKWGFRH